jgi:glutamyl-Q tRNA(Asp) synthetase
MPPLVSRFAPAPTGLLHLGHVVNAIYVWGATRAAGGRVLLRVEDHDRQRSRTRYERAILDDLDWLGFLPDEPCLDAFRAGPCEGRQSDRGAVYLGALDRLRGASSVYTCACSRRERMPADGAGEFRYPGTCALRQVEEGISLGLRVVLPPDDEVFDDLRHGPQVQRPAEQCGDLLVRDRRGNWTYQFAVAVDDLAQGVTLVVRGDDLLPSTGRQIQLARLLGRAEPAAFLHHPLVMKTPTQKLSKSEGDVSVAGLRARGWTAGRVIAHAAASVGLVSRERSMKASDAPDVLPTDLLERLRRHP